MDIRAYLKENKAYVDKALERYFSGRNWPYPICDAMYYSIKAGGKRIRPILAIASCEACGGDRELVMPAAIAIEMIHTFSLIHDDLPAMDNDDLRRGVPTNHKVFGEAMAILAGDALLSEAFYCLASFLMNSNITPLLALEIIGDIASATGPSGMVGGQVLDMKSEGQEIGLEELKKIHTYKTGRLITVSVTTGAKCAGAKPHEVSLLLNYGNAIGLAFQIADDILDIEGSEEEIGKPVGSDIKKQKATFPAILGIERSRELASSLIEEAVDLASHFGQKGWALVELARYIIERKN
jgi:geranylgeranyl diphosphate synthase type II